uniref:J domain-containing protein n=1 Tax=Eutreptiella gymnastica TaxID=73025 RepID=A0A7S1NNI6_9EUGL
MASARTPNTNVTFVDDPDDEASEDEVSEEEVPEEDANDLKNQGNECYGRGDYWGALEFYTRSINKDPENPKVYGNRAAAYMMLGRYDDVIADCKKAIEIDASFGKAYGRLAKAYFLSGDFSRSLDKYKEAITLEINPDLKREMDVVESVRTCYDKARAALDNQEFDKGLTFAKLVLKEAPDAIPFKVLFSEAMLYNRQPDQASQILGALMWDNMNNTDVLTMRAKALFYCGQQHITKATEHLTRALSQDPDDRNAVKLLKQIRHFENLKAKGNDAFKNKKWTEAIDAYTETLAVDPHNVRMNSVIYCNRAAAYKEEGMLQQAINDCNLAIKIDDQYVKAYQRRARCHQAAEDHEAAVRDFDKVMQLNPSKEAQAELREAKILLKRSKRKDYYKILGVSRDADERQIKRSYREQALKLHPDKLAGCTDEEKEKAEMLFKDVGEAYAVLSDPMKKRKYDNGTYDDGSGQMDADDVDASNVFNMFFGGGGFPGGFSGGGHRGHRGGAQFSFHM